MIFSSAIGENCVWKGLVTFLKTHSQKGADLGFKLKQVLIQSLCSSSPRHTVSLELFCETKKALPIEESWEVWLLPFSL